MKKFIHRVVVFFLIIFSVLFISEIIVSDQFGTFRSWEHLGTFNTPYLFSGPFYPNQRIIRDEYGDLLHHTKDQIKKENIEWRTDSLGYRNDKFLTNPDAVFIGYSNIVGSASSQENIISNRFDKLTGYATINIAPCDFHKFVNYIELGVIDKPKFLIYGAGEGYIPSFESIKFPEELTFKEKFLNEIKDLLPLKLKLIINKLLKRRKKSYLKARLAGIRGRGIKSNIDDRMFFLQRETSEIKLTNEELEENAQIIFTYSEYCRKNNIKFIFFPIPNKETVYYELVPYDKQPNYLDSLIKVLKLKNVATINTVEVFNKNKTNTLLYHYDDIHWNKEGIELIAKELAQLTKKDKVINDYKGE